MSSFWLTEDQEAIREGVAQVCSKYDDSYWLKTDDTGKFPEDFVADMAAGAVYRVSLAVRNRLLPQPSQAPSIEARVGVAAVEGGRQFWGNDVAANAVGITRDRLVLAGGVEVTEREPSASRLPPLSGIQRA